MHKHCMHEISSQIPQKKILKFLEINAQIVRENLTQISSKHCTQDKVR